MNWRGLLIVWLLFAIPLAGCAKRKNFIMLTPDAAGQVGALQMQNEQGTTVLDQGGRAIYVKDRHSQPSAPASIPDAELRAAFGAALDIQPLPPQSYLLYFTFDSNNLTAESSRLLDDILQAIRDRDSQDIVVIGHTDLAGNDQYNLALSQQRAQTVYDLLVDKGIRADFVQIESYGEGNPLIRTADEVAEVRNRRVEVLVR